MRIGIEWIFPIIVAIFWILGQVLKAREENEKPKRPAGRAPGQELDRFLEEIERLRREQAAKARAADGEEPRPIVVVPRPAPRPRPAPAPRPQPALAVTLTPTSAAQLAAPKPPPAVRPAPPVTRRPPDMIGPVLAMLRNPRTMAAAVVLHEILGPPKSRRP